MTKKYFPKPINSTDEFFEKLEREGKVRNLNSPEDLERQNKLNEGCLEVRRDYLILNANSIRSARECFVSYFSFYMNSNNRI